MDSISHSEDDITQVYISILKLNKYLANQELLERNREHYTKML